MKQKNWQGGLCHQEAPHEKRMYATRDPRCPVASLRGLLERTPASATSLYNHCSIEALPSPQPMKILYAAKPCKQHHFRSSCPIIHEILAVHEITQGSERSPRKRKVVCSNPRRDKPKSLKQIVTAPLPNTRHKVKVSCVLGEDHYKGMSRVTVAVAR